VQQGQTCNGLPFSNTIHMASHARSFGFAEMQSRATSRQRQTLVIQPAAQAVDCATD
jgi:hypothetical protein